MAIVGHFDALKLVVEDTTGAQLDHISSSVDSVVTVSTNVEAGLGQVLSLAGTVNNNVNALNTKVDKIATDVAVIKTNTTPPETTE